MKAVIILDRLLLLLSSFFVHQNAWFVTAHKHLPYFEPPSALTGRIFVSKSDLDVRTGLLKQREAQLETIGESLTIMCVGESGTGKSTLIANIFTAPITRSSESRSSESVGDPTLAIVESHLSLDCEGIPLKIKIIDTPGYGDDIDVYKSFRLIGEYIDSCFARALAWEKATDRSNRPQSGGRLELGVDAVLYFISPHRIKGIDIQFLRHIQGRATIIPIIAKADTLTTQELAEFRTTVAKTLAEAGITYLRGPFAVIAAPWRDPSAKPHQLRPAQLAASPSPSSASKPAGDSLSAAVAELDLLAAGDAKKRPDALVVRGRQYPWGFASCEDVKHSDLGALRRCLLIEGLADLHAATNTYYETYRRNQLPPEGPRGMLWLARRTACAAVRLAPGWIAAGVALRVTARLAAALTGKEPAQLPPPPLQAEALHLSAPESRPWWQAGKGAER